MPVRNLLSLVCVASLSACALRGPPLPPAGGAPPAAPPPGSSQPAPQAPGQGSPQGRAGPAVPRQFRLSEATGALVTQAHAQSGSGEFGPAAATLERALRIEPDNPLLWIELGRVRLGANDASQADALGRKALALAVGDGAAQASAWHLVADALRSRGRNGEAAEAEQHALAVSRH